MVKSLKVKSAYGTVIFPSALNEGKSNGDRSQGHIFNPCMNMLHDKKLLQNELLKVIMNLIYQTEYT